MKTTSPPANWIEAHLSPHLTASAAKGVYDLGNFPNLTFAARFFLLGPRIDTLRYELTQNAKKVLEERGIPIDWMERAFLDPEEVLPDPADPDVRRFFRSISEFENRVLRVAVNTAVEPPRVVSVFFDRNRKRKP